MPVRDVKVFIGLGSNLPGELGSPQQQITSALQELDALPQTRLINASPLYHSRAVGPEQPDYINAVAQLNTRLEALALLDALQALEQQHRRVRLQHWGPRTLDLDLLLYGNDIIDHPRLTVPHAFLTQRAFVLYPLADLAPELVLPCGTPLLPLLANCPTDGLQRFIE
jgi:2-amino-4-hydroxy-6-hydroxymethyldihydropteridine diphosphokinase